MKFASALSRLKYQVPLSALPRLITRALPTKISSIIWLVQPRLVDFFALHSPSLRFKRTSPAPNMSPPTDNRIVCPRLGLTPSQIPPSLFDDEISFFTSIPWTAALLKAPDAIPFLPACRNPNTDVHDQLFGSTLRNDRAIQHILSICRVPSPAAALDPAQSILEIDTLVYVGDGVSGFPNVVHGGIVASLLDESMGCIFDLNISLGKTAQVFQTSNVTGGLNVTYLKRVPTNSLLRITAKVEEINGRKSTIQSQIRNEKGEVLAKCESKWVALKPSL